jgi:hypothetical protein
MQTNSSALKSTGLISEKGAFLPYTFTYKKGAMASQPSYKW